MSTVRFPPSASIAEALQQVEMASEDFSAYNIAIVPILNPVELSVLSQDHPLLPHPRWFWSPRNNSSQMFCFGFRKRFNSIEEAKAESNIFPTLFSRPFSQPKKDSLWDEFELTSLVQPAMVIHQGPNERTLKIDIASILRQQGHNSGNAAELPITLRSQHKPEQQEWASQIKSCAKYFERSLRKVVLARQSVAPTNKSPVELFKMLIDQQPDCYHFFLSPSPMNHFMSCTPEQLCSLSETHISTEALAGTRPRDKNTETNEALRVDLLNSSKDALEHHIVTQHIKQVLDKHCQMVSVAPQHIKQLRNVQHLCTPITGTLRPQTDWDRLIEELHPTPAVCGQPQELARDLITQFEPFDRGLYAGIVGVIFDSTLESAVSIRSALWKNHQLFIWAGAGIVSNSDPDSEWQEICTKSQQFFELVNE